MAIAQVLRRRLGGSALAALTTFALLSGVSAQSTDPNHPAPLGPGVNRGNVDNSGKGHTFYFYAGPGHIDVDMAFEEMGLFGAPLRQTTTLRLRPNDISKFAFGGNRIAMTKHSAQARGLSTDTMLSEDRGAGARRSRESGTGRSNSIVFGHKVRGGRLTCARHPWDIFKVTRCCRVVGGSRVLFSFGYGSNYLRR